MIRLPVFPARSPSLASYASFAAFGIFWGTWGASVPGFRSQAGISDGQLGTALLFIGAGALPAMLLTGRVIDRLGVRFTAAVALTGQGVSGLIIALGATDFTSLCLGLLLVGAASGTADVAINAAAGSAEQAAARPVITRSHGMFSAFVVISSLGTGLSASLGTTIVFSFVVVVAASVIVGLFLMRALPPGTPSGAPPGVREEGAEARDRRGSAGSEVPVLAVLLLGTLGALAFAGENAHQSWSAVFFGDELGAGPGLSSTAPAVFAAVVAITRFSAGALKPSQARGTLIVGAAAAGLGAAILAAAPNGHRRLDRTGGRRRRHRGPVSDPVGNAIPLHPRGSPRQGHIPPRDRVLPRVSPRSRLRRAVVRSGRPARVYAGRGRTVHRPARPDPGSPADLPAPYRFLSHER